MREMRCLHSTVKVSNHASCWVQGAAPLTRRKPIGVVDLTLLDLLMQSRHVLIVERHLTADEHKQYHSKAPHVYLGPRVWLRLQQLGGGKVETAAVRLELPILLWRKEVAQAEVDNLDVASLADQNVLYLQIPMHNAVAVAVVDSACYLPRELAGLLLLELAVRDDVVEHLAAVDVFEEHVPVPFRPQAVAEAADVLVVEQSDDGSLAGVAVLPSGICLLPLLSALAAVVG